MVHAVLIISGLALAALGFAYYMWDTREERREFARRVAKAEKIRRSMTRHGRLGGWY